MKLRAKLVTFFLLVGIIPALIVTIVALFVTSNQLTIEAENKLEAVKELKKSHIQDYFDELIGETEALANNYVNIQLIEELLAYRETQTIMETDNYPITTSAYKAIYNKYYNDYKNFVEQYGFYDIILINKEYGQVFFTYGQERDWGTNLKFGEYKDTHLATLWKNVVDKKKTTIADFKPYRPSNDEPAAFIGTPVIKDGEFLAIFIIQIPITKINKVMQDRTGMGKSGESYLVGDDYLMRSDSFLDPTNHSILASFKNPEKGSVKTEATKKALNGETGTEKIIDYNGNEVYSSYSAIDVGGVKYAIMSEIDVSEINEPIVSILIIAIVIAIIIAVVILIVSILLSMSIANPIKKITMMVKNIAEGKVDSEKILSKSKDEIGVLSKSINVMLDFLVERNEVMDKIAKGDLTVKVRLASDEDDVGKSLSNMVESLGEIVKQIDSSVDQITQGSNQISESTQSLSTGSSEQASSLEEITSTITEIATQAQQNVDNALKADEIAKQTKEFAEKGNEQMKELVAAMEKINKSSNDIKNIIRVIDDLAFQTNLLALNADIEAARVGKYGRGFAVVATSVRTLAGKSATAVKETSIMVEEAIRNIEKGNHFVGLTAKQLEDITIKSSELRNIVREVSQASQEQAAGIEETNTGLGQIEDVVQSNSANAEENAAATEELSSQAKRLKDMIAYFNTGDNKHLIDESEHIITKQIAPKKETKKKKELANIKS